MPRVSGKRVFANVLGDGLATMWKISLHCTLCFHCRLSLTWSCYHVELGNKPEAQIAVKVLFSWVPWNLDTKLEFVKIFPGYFFLFVTFNLHCFTCKPVLLMLSPGSMRTCNFQEPMSIPLRAFAQLRQCCYVLVTVSWVMKLPFIILQSALEQIRQKADCQRKLRNSGPGPPQTGNYPGKWVVLGGCQKKGIWTSYGSRKFQALV